MTRKSIGLALSGIAALIAFSSQPALSHEEKAPSPAGAAAESKAELKLETLLRSTLEGVKGTEVIVSRVTMPPHTTLPKHWHPGEEFAYVLEGTVVLWQDGKEDIDCKPGDALGIPLKQVHTAMTKDEGATILVFRVHEQGKPERVVVE